MYISIYICVYRYSIYTHRKIKIKSGCDFKPQIAGRFLLIMGGRGYRQGAGLRQEGEGLGPGSENKGSPQSASESVVSETLLQSSCNYFTHFNTPWTLSSCLTRVF